MIPDVITDEEIEAEWQAVAHFHTLRKGNSSRSHRQAAYMEVFRYRMIREARAWRAHPIQPSARWSNFNDSAPKGWTYPGLRTLERDEVDELFPGALAAFATQCDNLAEARFVFDQWCTVRGRLKLSVPMNFGHTRRANLTWLPEVGIWRRYHRDVKAKPYRKLEADGTPADPPALKA